MTKSNTLTRGGNIGFCGANETDWARFLWVMFWISSLSNKIWPLVGFTNPAINFMSVVLPVPFLPTTDTNSPLFISSEILSKMTASLYEKETFFIFIEAIRKFLFCS